jgi:hypothetical protein
VPFNRASEVNPLAENHSSAFTESIRGARQRLTLELRAQGQHIHKLNLELAELQQLQERTQQEADRQFDDVARVAADAATELEATPEKALAGVLSAVRALVTCTLPEQVFAVLTEEVAKWGLRAAIFDVRGNAAWGASAHGFKPALSEKILHALVVPLTQDNPFRQVCHGAGHVTTNPEMLKKNRNVLDKLKPASHAPILLLPISSAGSVTAIFYADPGESGKPLPVNALKILAEFTGAQLDRLIGLGSGLEAEAVEEDAESPAEEVPARDLVEAPAPAESQAGAPMVMEQETEAAIAETPAEAEAVEPSVSQPEVPATPAEAAAEPEPADLVLESEPAPPIAEPSAEVVPSPVSDDPPAPAIVAESAAPQAPAAFDPSQLSDAEQKVHKDAKRFAKLLVSEIELYNKAKVADGRKNQDLYSRLKSDIDRSRQTFEKRFGKALSKQVDYFHDELVKTLAANDSAALGPEYPGPSA